MDEMTELFDELSALNLRSLARAYGLAVLRNLLVNEVASARAKLASAMEDTAVAQTLGAEKNTILCNPNMEDFLRELPVCLADVLDAHAWHALVEGLGMSEVAGPIATARRNRNKPPDTDPWAQEGLAKNRAAVQKRVAVTTTKSARFVGTIFAYSFAMRERSTWEKVQPFPKVAAALAEMAQASGQLCSCLSQLLQAHGVKV